MSLAALRKYDKIRVNCFIQYSSLNSSEATEQYIGKVYIFFEHEYQGVIHYTALVQHCRTIDIRYGYKVVQVRQDIHTRDRELMPSRAEFIDIGAIDCLVGLVGVDPGE